MYRVHLAAFLAEKNYDKTCFRKGVFDFSCVISGRKGFSHLSVKKSTIMKMTFLLLKKCIHIGN
jgi:hypothetical protein